VIIGIDGCDTANEKGRSDSTEPDTHHRLATRNRDSLHTHFFGRGAGTRS
jgi:hypothetical protein